MSNPLTLQIIGRVRTPFPEKFGIPRQSGLVEVPGIIEMEPPWDERGFFEGLEEVSHLWITFLFHGVTDQGWKGRVRPPRLGGNRRLGVFATRSPFRPNHLGLSVVRLREIESHGGRRTKLHVFGVDLLDGTPVLDIKPYIPYVDAIPDAHGGFAAEAPGQMLRVRFDPQVEAALAGTKEGRDLIDLIRSLIALDPRPAYASGSRREREYGMRFRQWNIRWIVDDARDLARVIAVEPQ